MTFLEICQRVLDEGDRTFTPIQTVRLDPDTDEQVYKVVNWVKRAYTDIQRWNPYFKFLHADGVLFTTVAGTSDYSVTGVRKILRDSVTARVPATPTDKWELLYLTYRTWRDQFIVANFSDSRPIWFTELPSGQYRLTPAPDQAYEILCDRYKTLDRLVGDDDIPIWSDRDDDDIIVWQALMYYISEYEVPEELATRVQTALPRIRSAFLRRYVPEYELGGYFA